MAKGIGIVFNADSAEVVDESKKVRAALGDIEGGLGEVADESKDAAREQQDALEGISDATKEMGDAYESAGDDASGSLKTVTGAAGDVTSGLKDLGGAAKDALEGDLSSAAAGGLDALSGLAAAIPGIGAIIGVIFAEVGKGVVEMWQTRAAESEERIREMYQDFAKSGNEYLSAEFVNTAAEAILGDPAKYAEAQELAAQTGLALSTVIQGLAGDSESRSALESAIIQKMQEQRDLANEQRGENGYLLTQHDDIARSLQDQLDKLNASNGERDEAYQKGQLLYEIQQQQTAEAANTNDELAAPVDKTVTITADLTAAERQLIDWTGIPRSVRLDVEGYDRNGMRVI